MISNKTSPNEFVIQIIVLGKICFWKIIFIFFINLPFLFLELLSKLSNLQVMEFYLVNI